MKNESEINMKKFITYILYLNFIITPILADELDDITFFTKESNLLNIEELAQENIKGSVEKDTVQADDFDTIIPVDLKYYYQEPINRPKWSYPLAWVGYIGTCFMIPFPIYMKNKDNAIDTNNQKWKTMRNYEQRYWNDIEKCKAIYKTDNDLYKCYQEVKISHQSFINNVRMGNIQEEQTELQRQQLQAQRYSNYLRMQQNNNLRNINNSINRPRTYYNYGNRIYSY